MSHKVTFNIPNRVLGKADLIFVVKENQKKIGTLRISKGGVVWRSRNIKRGKRQSWKRFDALMATVNKKERKRTVQTKARKSKGS